MKIEIEIAAIGEDSSIPECPEAVDVDIYADGKMIGGATLWPHAATGRLAVHEDQMIVSDAYRDLDVGSLACSFGDLIEELAIAAMTAETGKAASMI